MRLNKYLAEKTGISRREADDVIIQGKVLINGEKPILGAQVSPGDKVEYNGKEITHLTENTTIILNKPVGYLSSRRSQGGDPTVYDLLPVNLKTLKTAGRLDKDSSGLMILSSDGDLIQQLTHPRFSKTKVYEVELDKPLEPLHQQMINDIGIDLPDGKSQMALEKIGNCESCNQLIRVIMTEGRNRQIRRTFEALGYTVIKLHRTNLGPYSLNNLRPGKYLEISR